MNIFLFITVILLCLFVVFKEIICFSERKDLYNRLMAKNLTEYNSPTKVRHIKNVVKENIKKNEKKLRE